MAKTQRLFIISVFVMLVAGCVTAPPPNTDYAMAKAALDAARAVDSARYSPGNWHQADESYRRGESLYRDREYVEAQREFIEARIAAEKAENAARLIRMKNGEVL